ncbi:MULTISPECIES: hypothetical protein [Vibrio]|uniref:hypothetical protein n=1 Tax=Vibrio TaxID=662 RepID=UPI0014823350|nr:MULTISPECIES: hypothetical protein [Vibrio]MDQ2166101.1 hypothetical protein [Vibrio anguillarum]NNN97505.1 hypothetical protein [Vibrio sp. B4-6]
MEKKLTLSVILFALFGCNGGDSTAITNGTDDNVVEYQSNGLEFTSISSGIDVNIDFYNQLTSVINKSKVDIILDVNNNSIFDDGDVRLKIGNQSLMANVVYGSEWISGDFILEFNDGGNVVSFRYASGFIIGGNNVFSNDLGSVSYYRKTNNSNLVENKLIVRINNSFTTGSSDVSLVNKVKVSLANISKTTGANVYVSDGIDSFDYLPGMNLFTQGDTSDNNDDFIGSDKFVDLKSIKITKF